jgi:hypothetical protein
VSTPEIFLRYYVGKTRRPGVFAVPVLILSIHRPYRNRSECVFAISHGNRLSAPFRRASHLSTRHICRDLGRRHAGEQKKRNAKPLRLGVATANHQSLITFHFSPAPTICVSSSTEWRLCSSRSGPPLPPNIFIRTEKKIGVNNTPKKVTPIIPANTAVPSA